jgi:hypothetical protein
MPRFDKNPIYRRHENNVQKRAAWFASFNREAMARGCWIISSPGATEVIIECLPGNDWPDELKTRGFPIRWLEEGRRVIPFAYNESMIQNADGTLAPLAEGSTAPIAFITGQPGIVKVRKYAFTID